MAILALLGTVAVSCQKEADTLPSAVCSYSEYNVLYRIDNNLYYANIQSPDDWHTFLDGLLAYARQGHNVSIQRTSSSQTMPTKEVFTFETTNEEDAIAWADNMTEHGYAVTIKYDEKTGIYSLTAEKP